MFQKPAFGATSTGFGSFNSATPVSSPFGSFKPAATTSAFGAPPAFGAAANPQPAATGGLFGASNTSGGLFGASAQPAAAPSFGATTSGFGFGATTSTGGGLFGNNTSTGLFGNTQNNSAFGAKPAGFGFGATTTPGTTGGGLFGATNTGLFGQQTNTMGGGGLFANNTSAFGQQQTASGTGHVKYNPVVGTDVVVKSGTSQNINIKHHCITCMKEYEGKSLEELRLEDYTAGRKGTQGGAFGGFQQQPTDNKMLFGGNSFGQPATTSAPSVFGGGTMSSGGAFGQTNTFSFGGAAQNTTNTTGLFGGNKPAFGSTPTTGTSLFGATTTQAPAFGTNTSTFGFGATTANQSGGIFGAKQATPGFGGQPASTGFGAFGANNSLFGAKPPQTTSAPFGAPLFGQSTGFNTSTSSSGGIFGANTFGKPATTQQGFGLNMQSNLGTGLGTGLGGSMQAKPASAFGTLGGSTMFQQPAQNTFRTGLDSGLGGGMFNNAPTLGGSSLGMGMLGANNTGLANTSLGGASVAGNVHEQMLTLAARPYGDSPLFKDLLPDTSTTAEDVLKPTNPSAVKAVLERSASGFRVTPPHSAAKLQPRPIASHDKKSLFDGLEESDASLEDKLCLKPSRKRLSLRPRSDQNVSTELHVNTNRSLEDSQPQRDVTSQPSGKENDRIERGSDEVEGTKHAFNEHKGPEITSDRNASWLSSATLPWNSKEKPMEGEPTPRLYPSLDKETAEHISERRASWLTTKSLRKPVVTNSESAENSVRELGVRDRSENEKENIDTLSVSEEEHVSPREAPPYPTGVKLTRPGYYTIPTLDEMTAYMRSDGTCVVPHLTIGRTNYGNVYYDCEVDVAGLDLDSLVHFMNKEVIVYPEDSDKPPVGSGLNKRAIVTLDRIWPRDKTEKRPITDPDRLLKMDYEGKLRRVCDKHDTKFIEYRPSTGSWVFRVEHFSKYGLTDSDEEDDVTPDVLKRQLVNQSLQKASAAAQKPPVATPMPSAGLGGLGFTALPGTLPGALPGSLPGALLSTEDNLFAMHQTSLHLLNGAGKAFEMDTTEDHAESQSLYQDRAFGVRSPTSELARLEHRQSQNVQLMKASLYADTEMEDDISVSTGDQQVPILASVPMSASTVQPVSRSVPEEPRLLEVTQTPRSEEATMPPLIVNPHTIVLRYHRKVPPFRKTIAGGLDAACIADMSVCRARHSRVSFGPRGALVFATSYDSIADLPKSAELSELGKYVRGRLADDWSESVVARLAIGQVDAHYNIQEILSRHLDTLLKYSTSSSASEDMCPQLKVRDDPEDRLAVLREHLENAAKVKGHPRFGVSGTYSHEVWSLCDALWSSDLQNGGVCSYKDVDVVLRHNKLLQWLTEATREYTDAQLARTVTSDIDESDAHSTSVWALVLGGRILEACKLAKKHGDLNMAILIAQGAGDPSFRSLIARQLSQWRECGADALISKRRLETLQLIAGLSTRDNLIETAWLPALHATARYLCPHVPSLETVVRKFEGFYRRGDEEVDLTTLEDDEMGMPFPLPPYMDEYDVSTSCNGKSGRVLDLRYELIRARALNTRAKLRPASYTPDPLDYSLCFLLGTWFGNPSVEAIVGIADQLEATGGWHLAVLTLAYHPDDIARGHLIRSVLSRHAPAKADTPELKARLELMEKLNVPRKWVLLAQAHRAKYEHLPSLQAQYLADAGSWTAAHTVLMEELFPPAVLADDLQSISSLLDQMNAAATQQLVNGWETGGKPLYLYLQLCTEIRGAVELWQAETGAATRLETLRPALAAAARSLAKLQAKSVQQQAARSEMGARIVQLALAAGEPTHHLATLLRALNLPPDCTQHAHLKITTDLASQAAELCIDSPISSPLSTRQAMQT